ncbi:hypothetical protein [Mesomycoplasma ovipneumoniae]|uniref:hypothetical protein n=1 Tax=Mesomycoplasma ovipneumoniae TaxID=29562 RepID=UPI00083E75D3|nr:hypothetical protein [Mesomycoplasma ovipneumoniae]
MQTLVTKSIFSVSGISPSHTSLVKKSSGYYQKYEPRTTDFEKTKKAVDNLAFICCNKENESEVIFTSHRFWVNSNSDWVNIGWSNSYLSNNELIDFKAEKSGYYRIYIKKFKSSTFDNPVEDKLALSYLVDDEN